MKLGAPLTMTKSFTIRRTLSRSPTAALSTGSNSIATSRAATLPCSRLISPPTFPQRGLPSILPRRPERCIWSPERMNGANAGTYPSTTGGMTSGRTMLRDFKRSSMDDMSCFLPRLRHDDKESIYVLSRIEQMWSDSNFAFTQGNHEPLVSQRLIQKLRIAAAADFNATKNTALRGLPRTCQPIALRESFEEIVNQGL